MVAFMTKTVYSGLIVGQQNRLFYKPILVFIVT